MKHNETDADELTLDGQFWWLLRCSDLHPPTFHPQGSSFMQKVRRLEAWQVRFQERIRIRRRLETQFRDLRSAARVRANVHGGDHLESETRLFYGCPCFGLTVSSPQSWII